MTLENPFQPAANTDAEPDPPEERPYTPAEGLDPEAPYGYTIDRTTGAKRPRKRAGRAAAAPKAEPEPEVPKPEREPDKVPGKVKPPEPRRRGGRDRKSTRLNSSHT